ncbi:MAG: hypothetical protein IJE05_02305 [Clostridia bacterium]|nr:hypothetical protein [Clostridia bacterium]
MKRRQKNFLRRMVCSLLAVVIFISNFAEMDINVKAAVYSANGVDIIYDGEGEISKSLSNGKNANVTVKDSVINITVNGERYGYYSQICVATCVISEDDLLHIFWHTGDYYVYDLYESGMFIRAYKNSTTQVYCSEDTIDAYMVKGSSAANVTFHSCIIDGKYFYQYGKTGKKLLMTREEFQNIVNPSAVPTAEPTQVPTEVPTQVPTAVPTQVPTEVPTQVPTAIPTQVPTEVPTQVPTAVPTQVPTEVPTQVPTAVPTQVPTEVPTQVPTALPTLVPTVTPVVEIDSKTEFDFEFWWKMYIDGTITWEQFKEIMWEYHWTSNSQVTENSTTYYFYDEDGKLIKEETVTIKNETETGSGSGTATEETNGKAEVDIDVEGNGEVSGEVTNETDIYINAPTSTSTPTSAPTPAPAPAPTVTAPKLSVSKKVIVIKAGSSKTITYSAKDSNGNAVKAKVVNSSNVATAKVTSNTKIKITAKKSAANCTYSTVTVKNGTKKVEITVLISKTTKQHARVTTSGSRIKIFKANNKLYGWLIFNRKTGKLNWNGYKMTGVKTCGFIQGSWNVVVVMKNGTVWKLPKTVKKGQTVHKTKIKCSEKAIGLNRDSYGFVKYVKLKCGGTKNIANK